MVKKKKYVPLYVQVADKLENSILENEYADGEKLPTEMKLCEMYNVSRITIRQALARLEQKNLLYSVHGRGTYVHHEQFSQGLEKITSFEQTLEENGIEGYTEVEQYVKTRISANIKEMFNADNINHLCLIGYGNGMPLVYYNSYMKSYLAERVYEIAKQMESEKKAFTTWDIYKVLKMRNLLMEQKIKSIVADNHIASVLKIAPGDPVVKMETHAYEKNVLIEYKVAYYRADKYSFTVVRELDIF